MNKAKQSENKLNRTQIARDVFAIAESIGMPDRQQIEQLTSQVIKHLEQQPPRTERLEPPLPGMEYLVPKPSQRQKPPTNKFDILAIVKEILAAEEPAPIKEVKLKMGTTTAVKTKVKLTSGISLSENALHVLQRRYLRRINRGRSSKRQRRCSIV